MNDLQAENLGLTFCILFYLFLVPLYLLNVAIDHSIIIYNIVLPVFFLVFAHESES